MKTIIYNGIKFNKDKKTGYYLSSIFIKNNKRIRLHRYIWENEKGVIPKGYHVHHKDFDKNNNCINNLECIVGLRHFRIHGKDKCKDKKWFKAFHEKGIEAAKLWHKSEDGVNWHKEHYKKMKDKLHKKKIIKCLNCEKLFEGLDNNVNKFCSNNCKSGYRRKSGVDNEKRICKYCGKYFTTNKYSKKLYCGQDCINRSREGKGRCL